MKPWSPVNGFLVVALACTCLPPSIAQTQSDSTVLAPKMMSTIPSARRTHCIGRYLVDLPVDFELHSGGWGNIELYFGLGADFKRVYASVDEKKFTAHQFEREVAKYTETLVSRLSQETGNSILLESGRLTNGAYLFRRLPNEFNPVAVVSEIHQLVGNRYVRIEQTSNDERNSGLLTYLGVDPKPAEARLKEISRKLRSIDEGRGQLPTGFCFQSVVFEAGQSDEVTRFEFSSTSVPDLNLTIYYHAVTGQPIEGLFERRDNNALPQAMRESITTVRRRNRLLGGMSAEERLDTTSKPFVQQIYAIETRTDEQNLAHPLISISMLTGASVVVGDKEIKKEGESTISDPDALLFWDAMVNSVRLRPASN